jgi:chromosome segregation protein
MRLKHLVLQGYKSFANKTEFEFPAGVTAIVGPNGTGKSNIADAIRWALGERSMSTLRAKSSADMIFAGGDGRARAGMAEVALTFDNADGGLPIAYSEVTIARRAYRSGENEYLINGSQVLLRDVEELLAGSSLSERTYTVVGQGVVDAALSLRPQERRALFEEAAGITLYRDRREKTIERLDETERNLERVQDIIAEIAPRLERLERDARQVEHHRRLIAHLERLQRTWYGHRWGQQQAALERALAWAAALEERLAQRRREAARLDQRLAEVREREGVLRGNLRDWYRRSGDLHDEVDQARRELAVSEERARLLEARRRELLEEIDPLRAQRQEQADRVAEVRQRVEELGRGLAEDRARLDQVEAQAAHRARRAEEWEQERAEVEEELRGQRARLEHLDRALGEAREELSRLGSERAVAEERARQLESRRRELVAGLEPLGREEGEQEERVAQARARVAELERALADRQRELSDLERAWQAFQEEIRKPSDERLRVVDGLEGHRDELKRLEQARREAQQQEADLVGELRARERMHATGAAYDSGVQALLQADLEGVVGPLAELIQVPPAWERAIEAALGSALHAVVVERRSVVEEARRILEEEGGRATLLCLDGLRASVSAEDLPSSASSAADLVSLGDEVRRDGSPSVVDVLLGPVALCEDLSEARALQPQMPPGSRCVTRAGIVLRADGVVVIGQAGAGSVLAEERARRELLREELPRRLEQVRRRLRRLDGLRQEEEERIASLESRLTEIDRRTARAREERTQRLQQELGEARTAVAVTRETLRSQRASLEHEASQLERIRFQRETGRARVAELREQHAAQLERARTLRLALEAPPVGDSGAQDSGEVPDMDAAEGFRMRLGEAHQRCRDLERQQETGSERVTALEERLGRLTREAAEARREAARFEGETLSEARTAVAVREASLDSERQALERESALLERLRSQVDARHQRAAELRDEREDLLQRVAELRREASRLETDLGEVRARIRPAEDTLERLEQEQTSLEERQQQAQDRLRAAEERYGRAELDVERRRDDLQLLAQRIDEDLGLVELELGKAVTAQAPLPMRPLVSELPVVEQLPQGLEDEMQFIKKRLQRLGAVNPNAPHELDEVRGRYGFLTEQAADLRAATGKLRHTVGELDTMMKRAFRETFDAVAREFSQTFRHLFDGGEAELTLTEPDAPLSTGVDIVARPPGKRAQRLALLSGGERALTAVALLFSLLHVSATPFCVFDEVDAMLDEANVGRFRARLEELSQHTQFIIITHNRGTVESADAVYGVSMGSNAVSQVVSLKMNQVERAN